MPYRDRDAKLAHDAAYRATRRADLAAKQRDYYRRNRQAVNETNQAWLRAHPEILHLIQAANSMNQRARRWGSSEKLGTADLRQVIGPCVYCGGDQQTWDHVVPLWKGGRNHRSNLVPCCIACNRRKGRYMPRQQKLAV